MNKPLRAVISIVVILAIGFGAYSSYQRQQVRRNYPKQLITATVLPEARQLTNFNLTDNKNQSYTNQNLIGHWSMIFFGFTNCGYICPTTMAALKNMTVILQQRNIKAPQVIMISVDPQRDTVNRLNIYVSGYNPNFVGLTGLQEKIDLLAKNLNVLYIKTQIKNGDENYNIDHSGAILLINPAGKLSAIFSMPHNPNEMAHDFALIQKYS